VWIEQAMVLPESTVLRLTLDEDFVLKSPAEREAWVADWIERNLVPALARLDKNVRHVFSHDYARHRDFSIWGATALTTGMRRQVPLVIEMHKVPYAQQKQITWYAIEHLPRRCGGAMDAGGNGETLAEETADKFGHTHVHQVKFNRGWYGTWMPKLVQGFEDGMIDIAADPNLAQDLRAIEEVDGIPMVAKARRKDVKDPDLYRHGDGASMLALGWFATLNLGAAIDFIPVPTLPRGYDNLGADGDQEEDYLSLIEPRASW
jgi:phage FluMu gp28-like protein